MSKTSRHSVIKQANALIAFATCNSFPRGERLQIKPFVDGLQRTSVNFFLWMFPLGAMQQTIVPTRLKSLPSLPPWRQNA